MVEQMKSTVPYWCIFIKKLLVISPNFVTSEASLRLCYQANVFKKD